MLRLLLTVPVLLTACSAPSGAEKKAPYKIPDPQTRVFNPQSGRFEWVTPDSPPVSSGADHTSRQPYR